MKNLFPKSLVVSLILFALIGFLLQQASARTVTENLPNIIATVQESVVNVQTNRSFLFRRWAPAFIKQYFVDFYERENQTSKLVECKGEGTGVIIDSIGLVLTNEHVISGADTIRIVFNDKTTMNAVIIGKNEKEDLALLKVEGQGPFSVIRLGDSDLIKAADDVYAIGTPYGYSQTVTKGIVSAVHREMKRGNQVIYEDVIQTDAAVNPGNSGGPLLNTNGEMIGMIYKQDWRGQGIGFAIPIKKIKNLTAELKSSRKAYERLSKFKSRLGFLPAEEKMESGEVRIMINEVIFQSATGKSGLRPGDILIKFQDQYVNSLEQLLEEANKVKTEQRIYLQILRHKRDFFTYVEVQS